MKPTVCMISPPSPFLLDERVFPALGILKVAAATEQLGYPVEHLDLTGCSNYEEAVRDHCSRTEANFFAITATTPQMVAATKIRNVIRESQPSWVRIILGGPHPTLVNAAVRHYSERAELALQRLYNDFDTIVAGDGEDAIGLALGNFPLKLIDADDPKGSLFLSRERLAELPFPARHLIDLDSYHYSIDGIRATPLIAQLGCPFGCNFCAGRDSAMLRRVRLRPTENIIAEMRHLYETYGIRGFQWFDDELDVNPKFMELLRAMGDLQEELGVEFRCRGFVKAELFTEEQAAMMYQVGFRRILCGFESGSDRILRNINKRATKDDNTKAMEISHKYGLGMKALMSLGHPGESPETIQDTEDWLKAVAPADFDATIITAYPGSPYYDRAREMLLSNHTDLERKPVWCFETHGDRLYMIDVDYTQVEDFYKGSLDGYRSYVFTDYIGATDLVERRDHLEREVRATLGIPFNQAQPAVRFEASMGQLPGSMYRKGKP
jgi:anaerobic magnesium-protoporphyrin IX monomethyl ester cyclase